MSPGPGRLVLLGHPVNHSLSPAFQNAALESADSALRYEAVDVSPEALRSAVASLRANRAAGNVTVPHKESMFALCDETTPLAKRVGAVNAFMMKDESLVGHNTDVEGVRLAARRLMGRDPADMVVGVVGAGGAAAAVLAAVESWTGCRAIVANRGAARRDSLTERFRTVAESGDAARIADEADIVVNASSLGLHPSDDLPIDPRSLANDTAVLDLVYLPDETPLVRAARAFGLRADDGLRMLVYQGAASFEWWFDRPADRHLMWLAASHARPKQTLD